MIKSKLHVDLQWLNRISVNLQRFRKIKTDTYNCRCNVCGDSKISERKTRLYFYVKKGQMNVMCQNCNYSHSFYKYMKDNFGSYFEDYRRETMFDTFTVRKVRQDIVTLTECNAKKPDVLMMIKDIGNHATPLLSLDEKHPARAMLTDRAFTDKELKRLWYTDNFKDFASLINAEATEKLMKSEPRIIIPFVNYKGEIEMIQGRSIGPSKIKYVSIKAHNDIDKVFGMYEADEANTVYCVEGPFDSLFVDNCVASCDANLTRVDADVYVWDNQPRNKDVIKYMQSAIDAGKSIVIWPTSPDKKQDINDLIQAGVSRELLMKVIRQSTYKGISAKLKFTQWKRI